MPKLWLSTVVGAAVFIVLIAGACGGDGEERPTTAVATPSEATATEAPSTAASPDATGPSAPVAVPAGLEDTADKLSRAAIRAEDVPPGFAALSDELSPNEEAAANQSDPATTLALYEECGRLLGRTVTYQAADAQATALAGEPVAYFSSVTAFASPEGATRCYEEALAQGAARQGGGIGRQFGDLFIDPGNVEVTPVEFPPVGDQSLAVTVSGETDAEGVIISLTVLVVSFRQGPTTAAVGAVKVMMAPAQTDVEPFARLVSGRIQEEFGP